VAVNGVAGSGGVFPDVPTSVQNIRIIPTDSLRQTDYAGVYHS
jgi:hypothetical protein